MTWSSALTRGVKFFALGAVLAIAFAGESRAQSTVPDNYIVTLKKGASPAAVLRDHKLSPKFLYGSALNGFGGAIPAAKIRALGRDARVARIEADRIVRAVVGTADVAASRRPGGGGGTQPPQSIPWGITRIGAHIGSSYTVPVAIIDTGIDAHPDLNRAGGINFISEKGWVDPNNYGDGNGHGTHVAGTVGAINNTIGVVGVVPNTPLYAVRVLNKQGSGTWQGVIAGVDWVKNHGGIPVANMSLGGPANSSVDAAVSSAIAAGVTFAVAAGNETDDAANHSPARVGTAITVAASDSNDVLASFSNFGDVVDFMAPGVGIPSTWKGGGYNTISGTSMASPHAAGAAAYYLSKHPGAAPAAVESALTTAADEVGGPFGRLFIGDL
jgi:subtilisin family serine protease